jgi:hypothetical protein
MSKSVFKISIILVSMLGLFLTVEAVDKKPPGSPPDIRILLSVDKAPTEPYHFKEPIKINLSLTNAGSDEVMRKGWKNMEFWLLLQFFDENGRLITSDKIRESTTLAPPPPRVFPDENGVLVQGAFVEVVEKGWFVSFKPFNAYRYYPLKGRTGRFRVKAVVPAITFEEHRLKETLSGIRYAPRYPVDTVKWYGDLQSDYASFIIKGDTVKK